eukprot:TRINITY_DN1270_c0_g1_i1.p6 TRINITY_DN1270_c0_g1~~TRINITY_DN1270_c0_g1_i1.p6  ORF type:complete len:234 (-),score=42.94 TRINITY_DN1270_c0_g1_i1:3234-3935(-)
MGNCLSDFVIEIERREMIPKCVLCQESASVAWGEMNHYEQHQWTWKDLTASHTVCLVDERIKSQQKEEFLEHLRHLKSKKFPRNQWVPQLKKISSGTEWHSSPSFYETDVLVQAALNEVLNNMSDTPKYADIDDVVELQKHKRAKTDDEKPAKEEKKEVNEEENQNWKGGEDDEGEGVVVVDDVSKVNIASEDSSESLESCKSTDDILAEKESSAQAGDDTFGKHKGKFFGLV